MTEPTSSNKSLRITTTLRFFIRLGQFVKDRPGRRLAPRAGGFEDLQDPAARCEGLLLARTLAPNLIIKRHQTDRILLLQHQPGQ